MLKLKRVRVNQQQEKRRKKEIMYRDDEFGGQENIQQIQKNSRALQGFDDNDIATLSKVIENSIVFGMSKSGKTKGKESDKNKQKRRRKFMIGLAQ